MSTLIHAREELATFRGRLIEPGDGDYDAARAILLPLARLDNVFADVERQISLAKEAPSRPLSNFGFHSQAGAAG